jgi:hypothetical protein
MNVVTTRLWASIAEITKKEKEKKMNNEILRAPLRLGTTATSIMLFLAAAAGAGAPAALFTHLLKYKHKYNPQHTLM